MWRVWTGTGLWCALAAASGAAHVVEQRGKAFSETAITVKAGEVVDIANHDTVTHSLFARGGGYDIHETQAPGQTSSVRFDVPGTVELRCAIHPQMVLRVTVEP